MDSYKWSVTDGCFTLVSDPAYSPDISDVSEAIRSAGYQREFSSSDDLALGASIAVYRTDKPSKPTFYVDLMGENSGIATFVADDFLALLATLQQIQPFLTLVRLDQHAWAAVSNT